MTLEGLPPDTIGTSDASRSLLWTTGKHGKLMKLRPKEIKIIIYMRCCPKWI